MVKGNKIREGSEHDAFALKTSFYYLGCSTMSVEIISTLASSCCYQTVKPVVLPKGNNMMVSHITCPVISPKCFNGEPQAKNWVNYFCSDFFLLMMMMLH